MYRAQSSKFLHILLDRYPPCKVETSVLHHLAFKHYYVGTNKRYLFIILAKLCRQNQKEIARLKFYESYMYFFI